MRLQNFQAVLNLFIYLLFFTFFTLNTTFAIERNKSFCFFSLNSIKDFAGVKKFLKTIDFIKVSESLEVGSYANQSFMNLLNSKKKCDALVISGHHRKQGFDGKRSHSFLSIDNLERWSCDPKWKNWFQEIKVVWLQGCATSRRQNEINTILRHRYAKVFPNATLFAWSGSAPLRSSYLTIPYHLANLKKILRSNDMGFTILNLLNGSYKTEAQRAWKRLRSKSNRKYLGIWNHTAQAFSPYFKDKKNIEIYNSTCNLLNPSLEKKRLNDVKNILENKENLLINIDLILKELDTLKRDPDIYTKYRVSLIKKILNSSLHKKLLKKEIYNKNYNIIKKINLYRLYLYGGESSNPKWEKELTKHAIYALNNPIEKYDHVELKHNNKEILLSMLKKLPNGNYLFKVEDSKKILHPKAFTSLLKTLTEISHPKKIEILNAISKNPHIEGEDIHRLVWMLRVNSAWNMKEIFKRVLSNPHTKPKTTVLIEKYLSR